MIEAIIDPIIKKWFKNKKQTEIKRLSKGKTIRHVHIKTSAGKRSKKAGVNYQTQLQK